MLVTNVPFRDQACQCLDQAGFDARVAPGVFDILVIAGLATPAWYLLTRLYRALLLPRGEYWIWTTRDALVRWYVLRAFLVVVKLVACMLLSLPALATCLLLALLPSRLLGTPEE